MSERPIVSDETLVQLAARFRHARRAALRYVLADTTGAIAGTILGVLHGATAIPETFVHRLELADVVTQVADDLFETGWGHGVGGAYEAADPQVDAFLERYRG